MEEGQVAARASGISAPSHSLDGGIDAGDQRVIRYCLWSGVDTAQCFTVRRQKCIYIYLSFHTRKKMNHIFPGEPRIYYTDLHRLILLLIYSFPHNVYSLINKTGKWLAPPCLISILFWSKLLSHQRPWSLSVDCCSCEGHCCPCEGPPLQHRGQWRPYLRAASLPQLTVCKRLARLTSSGARELVKPFPSDIKG